MKKKLLVLLLIVAMVFALVACQPKEDEEWNYFSKVYSSLEEETNIKLETIVYLQLRNMISTAGGRFLVWFGSVTNEDSNAQAKLVNDLAKKYDVPVIYNFDPVLDGGISETLELQWTKKVNSVSTVVNYNTDLRNPTIGETNSIAGRLRNELIDAFGDSLPDKNIGNLINKLVYFEGAELNKNGTVKEKEFKEKIKMNGKSNVPVYGDKTSRAYTLEDVVQAACAKRPSAAKGANLEDQLFSNITPFDYFSDSRFHLVDGTTVTEETTTIELEMAGGVPTGKGEIKTETISKTVSNFLTPSNSVFKSVTYHEFMVMLGAAPGFEEKGMKGDFLVHFGGSWCPNTQAMAWLCNKWAKDYGIDTIYLFDPVLDGDGTSANGGGINIRTSETTAAGQYCYTGLYAELLKALGGKFESKWNTPALSEKYEIIYKGDALTRMCVPNIMLLNNDVKDVEKRDGAGKVIDSVECEYTYSQTSNASSLYRKFLDEALDSLISQHQDAYYNPIVEESSSSSSSSSASEDAGC